MKSKLAAICLMFAGCANPPPASPPEPLPEGAETAPAVGTAVPVVKWLARLLMRLAGNTQITVKVETPSDK